jgi:aminopeptidase N
MSWEWKTVSGTVTHTLLPLRDGLKEITFDAGAMVSVTACAVNEAPVKFTHEKDRLTLFLPEPLLRDRAASVTITYFLSAPAKEPQSSIGFYLGWHWVKPDRFDPARRPGFWTMAEPEGARDWIPIYDYPNDMATSEVYVEAPQDWYVIGNGSLVDIQPTPANKTRTFHWKMTEPHASYLLSLAGGEMDVVEDTWQNVPLIYAVPRGEGWLIPTSFGDTKDMLTFFSERLGVKYPWPKYAQTCVFDFGGGQEHVSATTLVEEGLSEARDGVWPMADLNSHELAHQWFGDFVTCKDWSQIWLNESFATLFEQLYAEHARGKDAYDVERDDALQAYLSESRRYKRPIVTRFYPSPDAMFDSHTYPKGGLVLHMLRHELGDADFFQGLGYYLRKNAHRPVETNDLVAALKEATGRNLEPFFEQWVYKPGHPVLDYAWRWDAAGKQITLDIEQLQDTKDGTPIYTISLPIGVVANGQVTLQTVALDQTRQQFTLPCAQKPDAVLLDPGHDILMERRPKRWHPGEQEATLRFAPCALDRAAAATALLKSLQRDSDLRAVMDTVRRDPAAWTVAQAVQAAGTRRRAALREMYRALLSHKDIAVRAAADEALGNLPKDPADTATLQALINDKEPFAVVTAALNALSNLDADANLDTFRRALAMDSRHEVIRTAALDAIARSKRPEAPALILENTAVSHPRPVRQHAVTLLGENYRQDHRVTPTLVTLLKDDDPKVRQSVFSALLARKDPSAVPALRALANTTTDAEERAAATGAADKLEGTP